MRVNYGRTGSVKYIDSLPKKIGRLSFLLFIAFYWLTEIPELNGTFIGLRLPYSFSLLCVSIVTMFLSMGRLKKALKFIPFVKTYLFASGLLIFALAMSCLVNGSDYKFIFEYTVYALIPLVPLFLINNTEQYFYRILIALSVNGLVMASVGFYRIYIGEAIWVELIDHASYGYGSRNLDAFYMMIGMFSSFSLITKGQKKSINTIYMVVGSICLIGVFLSLSRGMLLTSIISILLLIAMRKEVRGYLIILGTIIIIGISSWVPYSGIGEKISDRAIGRFSLILDSETSQTNEGLKNSTPGRLNLIPIAFDMISESPIIGFGPGSFQDYAKRKNISISDPHNNYLLVWSELGTLAFLSFFVIAAIIPINFCVALNRYKKYKRVMRIYIGITFILIFTSFFTNYVTYFGYWLLVSLFFLPFQKMNRIKTNVKI